MIVTEEHKKELIEKFGKSVLFKEPMALHTSFRVGGPADIYIMPKNEKKLQETVKWAYDNRIECFVIGGGTNLLVTDAGIRGITIDPTKCLEQIKIRELKNGKVSITAMAGARTSSLCAFSIKHGYTKMEFAYGIPGTIGGAVSGNAGTASGCIADILTHLKILTRVGEFSTIERKDIEFSYRSFALKKEKNPIIVSASFQLEKSDSVEVLKKAEEIIKKRKKNQPKGVFSAGCFFKNPDKKKSAGKLIELSGLKGEKAGDAEISEKHANFIINRGNASASEIMKLAEIVRIKVKKKFSINLETEVQIVGEK